ncbi:MAG: HAD family hydrolase [Terracidiphilus sp.]
MSLSNSTEESLTPEQAEVPNGTARQWSAEEFKRMVLDSAFDSAMDSRAGSQPKVAVFDCDGTLWSGDAGYGFMVWSLEQGLVSRSTSDWIDTRHRAYRAGQVSELEICGEMVQIYAGLRDRELHAAAARYFDQFVRARIFAEMVDLVAALRARGVDLWAVSSTNRWVVAECVRDFGIAEDHILAAEVRVADGVITSELVDVPTDESKAASLRRVGLTTPEAVFGNSIHDLAMLEMARHPFAVNPSPGLLEAAARNGWGYFRPAAAEGLLAEVTGE